MADIRKRASSRAWGGRMPERPAAAGPRRGAVAGLLAIAIFAAACSTNRSYQVSIPQVSLLKELEVSESEGKIHVESVRDRRAVQDGREIGMTTIGPFNVHRRVVLLQEPSQVVRQVMEESLRGAGLLGDGLDDCRYVLFADLLLFDTRVLSGITRETVEAAVKVEVTLFDRATGDQLVEFEVTGRRERSSAFDVTGFTRQVLAEALTEVQGSFVLEMKTLLAREAVVRKRQPAFAPLIVPFR